MEEENDIEKDTILTRCERLHAELLPLRRKESNSKVWVTISVMTLIEIASRQERPVDALSQIITALAQGFANKKAPIDEDDTQEVRKHDDIE